MNVETIVPERVKGKSARDVYVDLVRRAGAALAEHADEYVPDQTWSDRDPELTLIVTPYGAKVGIDFEFRLRC